MPQEPHDSHDSNERVVTALLLAVGGFAAGLVAFYAQRELDVNNNFLLFTIVLFFGAIYYNSLKGAGRALLLRDSPSGESIGGLRTCLLYVAAHYSIVLFASILAINLSSDAGGLGFVLIMFGLAAALLQLFGGVVGAVIFALILYHSMNTRGIPSATAMLATAVGAVAEGAGCYIFAYQVTRLIFT